MKHLSDEQLGARLDGELPAKAAEAAERHLAGCSDCRERLAALSGADASLARALSHDPGEQYFETFADRVQARIAAGAAAGSREGSEADEAPSGGGWFSRPSALRWAGAAVTLVAVAVFALRQGAITERANEPRHMVGQSSRTGSKEGSGVAPVPQRRETDALSRSGADANEPRAGGRAGDAERARMAQGGQLESHGEPPTPGAQEISAKVLAERQLAGSGTKNEATTPARMQPVRTLPSGEQAPAQPMPMLGGQPKSFAPPPTDAAKTQKPAARPMAPTPASAPPQELSKATDTRDLEANVKRADEQVQKQKAGAAAPQPATGAFTQTSGLASGVTSPDADAAARPFKLCGKVTNAQGRTVSGATVTVVETGRSVTSGSDGSFCLEAPSPGATLSVLSLGYHEYRAKVSEEVGVAPLAVTLRSVETIGPGTAPTARLETVPAPVETKAYNYSSKSLAGKDAAKLSAPVTIPALPSETPDATAARHASEAALRSNTPLLWSKAGTLWSGVATAAKTETAANEARYRTAEARMHSWRYTHAGPERTAAFVAVEAFLLKAPAGEQRRYAEAWRGELSAR